MPRILIIDDDDAYRGIIKQHLEKSGYEAIDTAYPENALVMAVEREPDAILLDLSMPGMSGFELCQTLSSLSFTQLIPVFIISGQDERNKTFCQNLGTSRYFTKPIDFASLKSELRAVLDSKKLQRLRDIRVQLKLPLTLKGKHDDGSDFEVQATTENVSKSGFLCSCSAGLDGGSTFEVFLRGEHRHHIGDARLVRMVKPDDVNLSPRYGFQFTGLWASPLVSSAK